MGSWGTLGLNYSNKAAAETWLFCLFDYIAESSMGRGGDEEGSRCGVNKVNSCIICAQAIVDSEWLCDVSCNIKCAIYKGK